MTSLNSSVLNTVLKSSPFWGSDIYDGLHPMHNISLYIKLLWSKQEALVCGEMGAILLLHICAFTAKCTLSSYIYLQYMSPRDHNVFFLLLTSVYHILSCWRKQHSAWFPTDSLAVKESYPKQTPFIKPATNAVHHPRSLGEKCSLLVREDRTALRRQRNSKTV